MAVLPSKPVVRRFAASVTYRSSRGEQQCEEFPVLAFDTAMANEMALAYVLRVLRLGDFELRVVGA